MLKLTNVKKSFVEPSGNRLPILDISSYALSAGEQAVMIGRSGGGKSTLLHVIAGISRADSGSVEVDGLNLCRLPEAGCDRFRAEKMGYVFQTFNLMPGFTAYENVLLGMTFARGRKNAQRAIDLLDRVGLKSRRGHKPHQLSVGEQQRVAVARALANQPKLLLADEPTANVDPANQQTIVDLIRNTCRDENVALLMVTHAMEVAEQFDRVDQLSDINALATSESTADST
ncbi:MAG: ABC transporter ATP-binding protein [Planctomycetales bacterium]|nr:ABC transporter ATP-binding protein [Planctomycetales bacterium]